MLSQGRFRPQERFSQQLGAPRNGKSRLRNGESKPGNGQQGPSPRQGAQGGAGIPEKGTGRATRARSKSCQDKTSGGGSSTEAQASAWDEGRDCVSGARLLVAELWARELGQLQNLVWPLRLDMDEIVKGLPCRQGLAAGAEGPQGSG